MFIGMLFVCTCVGLPIMVPVYAAGQLDTSLFLELTALHLAPRAPELWLTVRAPHHLSSSSSSSSSFAR